MKGFHLTAKQLIELRFAHREAKRNNAVAAYKINSVILLGTGWTIKKVKDALLLDDETLKNYIESYQSGGIEGLVKTNYTGKSCHLSDTEIESLCEELDTHIYLTISEIIAFVSNEFGKIYTISGMRDLLHRLTYEYKKPKLVPGHPDIDAQEEFADCYEEFMLNKPKNTEVFFLDAVHPEHNTMASYGWIKRGETRKIQTNSGRERLNLHGAINAETHEVTLIESETINDDSTIDLLETLRQKYFMTSMIYIILDNAKYHYSGRVKDYLEGEGKNIKLVFLPTYSPNLNLIERLWHFFKKKVLYNRYYENITVFRQACIKFFRNIGQYSEEISNFMNADFHIA
jgi:transposase